MGIFIRLVDINDSKQKEKSFLESIKNHDNLFFNFSQNNFLKVPGYSFSYWLSNKMISIFNNSKLLSEYANCCTGMQTGNNAKYIKFWYEVDYSNTQLSGPSGSWFRYNCGGEEKKWYGNNYYLVFWPENGEAIKGEKSSVIRNESFFFKEGITWKRITGSSFSLRYLPQQYIFDQAGDSMFMKSYPLELILGFVNSKVAYKISQTIAPTLNLTAGNMNNIPIIECNENRDDVVALVKENIQISKDDWDSFETSWDFNKHPLL